MQFIHLFMYFENIFVCNHGFVNENNCMDIKGLCFFDYFLYKMKIEGFNEKHLHSVNICVAPIHKFFVFHCLRSMHCG